MVSVPNFSEEYIASQEALKAAGVDISNTSWRDLILPNYRKALMQGAEKFTVSVPITLLNFSHPRFVREVEFDIADIEINEAREHVYGIRKTAIEKFGTVASGGTPSKPDNYLDYHQLAEKMSLDDRLSERNVDSKTVAQYALMKMREELIKHVKAEIARTEGLGEKGPIKLPPYMNFLGQVFRTAGLQEFRTREKRQRTDNVFCVNEESAEVVIQALSAKMDKKYALPNRISRKDPQEGLAEEEVLGMANRHSLAIRRGIMTGYMQWQKTAALCADTGTAIPQTFDAEIFVDRRSGRDSEKITIKVPAAECGFYIQYKTLNFGISHDVLKMTADQLSLKWRSRYNLDMQKEGRVHKVENLRDAAAVKMGKGPFKHLEKERALDMVMLLSDAILNRVLEHKLVWGAQFKLGELTVNLSDFSFEHVSSTIRYSLSDKLLTDLVEAVRKNLEQAEKLFPGNGVPSGKRR